MAGSSYGTLFRITTFGESHGPAIGVIIDGAEADIPLDAATIQQELDRRRPGQSAITTARNEKDQAEILSGTFEGKTTGQPICLLIRNQDYDSKSYHNLSSVYRPGHATLSYLAKWGCMDHRGGGRASARETAARVAAGAVAKQILRKYKICSIAYVIQIGKIKTQNINLDWIDQLPNGEYNPTRCPDPNLVPKLIEHILEIKNSGDSLGGIIEAQITGVPAGLGEPVFDRLDAELAKSLMSIPAVKGVEIGEGFHMATLRGSETNDPIYQENGEIRTETNRAGGILGGISNGMPIIIRAAFKPPSSITHPIQTIKFNGERTTISTQGRHDPCVVPRAVPIVEAMLNCTILDLLYRQKVNLKMY
ncbi:MAG: aroC [Chlamydiales bacterium]|jgi:chorismate synthase|nr:aroC [Chlamydiales bacterium]